MKIATIGTGFIVDTFLQAVKESEGISCVAMYSRKKEHAQPLAEKYEIDTIYTNLEEMLEDDNINFVYVASPNSLHFSYTLTAMKAGKHVICEKPFTSTVKELDILLDYAKTHGRYLFEAITTAHMPNYHSIQDALPSIGPIRMIQCNFSQYSSRYDRFLAGETPNVFNPAFSGGALSDINIYNLHFVIGLFGKPEAVHYYPNRHANGIDTSGVAILSYPGYQAICVGCKDTKSTNMAQIQGEKGYIMVNTETSRCGDVITYIGKNSQKISEVQNENALYYELQDFRDIFKQEDTLRMEALWEESHQVMEVYEACLLYTSFHIDTTLHGLRHVHKKKV